MKTKQLLILIFTLLMFTSCGKSEIEKALSLSAGSSTPGSQNLEIKDGVLEGKIEGEQWVFISGAAKKDFFNEDQMSITMWDSQQDDPCNTFFGSERQVLTRAPKATGTVTLGSGDPMNTTTFYVQNNDGGMNYISTEGKIIIEEITETEVIGKMVSRVDGSNFVSGSFTLTRCYK